MTNVEIKSGYNSVWISGDSEKISVILYRSSTEVTRIEISRNPGLLERLFPSYYDEASILVYPTEKAFRDRIRKATRVLVEAAKTRDYYDEMEERRIIERQKREKESALSINEYAESLRSREGGERK